MAGCEPLGSLTEEQVKLKLRQYRESIRQERTNPGVKAIIAMIEMRSARAQQTAIAKGSDEHDKGVASGQQELLQMLQAVLNSQETAD